MSDKITRADKAACHKIRTQLDVDLPLILEHLGIKVRTGNMSFNPDTGEISLKIKFSVPRADGTEIDVDRENYLRYYLPPAWLDQTFSHSGHKFTVCGYQPGRRSKPVVCRRGDGKKFLFAESAIRSVMERRAA